MLKQDRIRLAARFTKAARSLAEDPAFDPPAIILERPRQTEHGDLACNVAMQLAKPLHANPRDIAQQLVDNIMTDRADGLVEALTVAGPGFINIRISEAARHAVIAAVRSAGDAFGHNQNGEGARVLVEFVSANPTGPLHVGHGRQAALGDCLCALLQASGWDVWREFYYNDGGAQIRNLAVSVQARALGLSPDSDEFPIDGYRGDYIADIAADYLAGKTVQSADSELVVGKGDVEDLDAIKQFAVACLRHEQDLDLRSFGLGFDQFYLESSLYADGFTDQVVETLIEKGHAYESDGALWLRTTDYGDDKDRVMRKSNGDYTYFVPDVAYHLTKLQRGFNRAINVQGSDHHGTIARVRAGLQALDADVPDGYPDYVLHKMVRVMRNGQEVKLSKRAGSYVTLRDLIDWCNGDEQAPRGRDAVRFFLISRKADSEFTFDVDLAVSRSDENPVYYVQYAHARICSVLAQDANGRTDRERQLQETTDFTSLVSAHEHALMARLAAWPDLIEMATVELAPHTVAFYLKDLAGEIHSYYNAERFLADDPALRAARLCLLLAARQVLRNGLGLLGVSAPERM